MKIDETTDILHSFAWNYVKYANMEGFRRDTESHISTTRIPFLIAHTRTSELSLKLVLVTQLNSSTLV